ncbi:MAG: hypothetical protein FWG10_11780 [Eubacteriaceae bacterium]|nr:hypothetical protein [Eubacteriaceae bacterium]
MSVVSTLYAVKCDSGYFKFTSGGVEIVGVNKASVFPSPEGLRKMALESGINGFWLVLMQVTESKAAFVD